MGVIYRYKLTFLKIWESLATDVCLSEIHMSRKFVLWLFNATCSFGYGFTASLVPVLSLYIRGIYT